MTATSVAKVFADLDEHERVLRRTFDWDPSGGLFDLHMEVAGSPTFDLLTSDAAGMLAGVGENPAVTSFFKGTELLMERDAQGFAGPSEEWGVGPILRQREELEAKLTGATGQSLTHEIGHMNSLLLESRFGLADFSAITTIWKMLKYNGEPDWLWGVGEQLDLFNQDWIERLKRSYPANWRDLAPEEIDQAVKLMVDPGLALAWVPRAEILRELLAAEDDKARTAVLETRSAAIVADAERVFDEITVPELAMTIDYAKKAVAAHKDGHTEAALALAAATLSNIVHGYMGETNFGPIRETFADIDPENDVGMDDFALYMVGKVWVKVNVRYEGNEDPGFNRNRTLHLIGSHYSHANLIAVLMLLAGLCRELHRFEARSARSAAQEVEPVLEAA